MKIQLLFILVIVVASMAAVADSSSLKSFDAKIEAHRHRTDSIRALLDKSENRLIELAAEESRHLMQLNEIELIAEVSQSYIDTLETEMEIVQQDLSWLTTTIDSLEVSLTHRKALMAKRLRRMYATGEPDLMSIILGASSPDEIAKRVQLMQHIGEYEQKLLEKIIFEKSTLEMQYKLLEVNEEHLGQLYAEKKVETDRLSSQLDERKLLVTKIQTEKESWESSVEELRTAQEELSNLIVNLISQRKKLSVELERAKKIAFERRKGKLMWPAEGTLITPFGKIVHPVYKTVTVSKGIVLEATKGTPVVSVAPGTVLYVGRMRGYGQFLVVDHSGGYTTVYTHLGKVQVAQGSEVQLGTLLGAVGESGSLTGAKLRFELRDANGALDPQQWLETR